GARAHLQLPGGSFLGLYLIPNSTAARVLRQNPANRPDRGPLAYFSFVAANPDHFRHVRQRAPGVLAIEYLFAGGDRHFNDAVLRFRFRVRPGGTPGGGGIIPSVGGGNLPPGGGNPLPQGGNPPPGGGNNGGGGTNPPPCGFDAALTGWTTGESGGSGPGRG